MNEFSFIHLKHIYICPKVATLPKWIVDFNQNKFQKFINFPQGKIARVRAEIAEKRHIVQKTLRVSSPRLHPSVTVDGLPSPRLHRVVVFNDLPPSFVRWHPPPLFSSAHWMFVIPTCSVFMWGSSFDWWWRSSVFFGNHCCRFEICGELRRIANHPSVYITICGLLRKEFVQFVVSSTIAMVFSSWLGRFVFCRVE